VLQLGVFLLISTAVTLLIWCLGRPAQIGLPLWRLWLQVTALVALLWFVIAPFFVLIMAAVAIVGRLLVMPVLVALGLMTQATLAQDNFLLAGVLGAVPLAVVSLLVFQRRVRRAGRWVRILWHRYCRRRHAAQ
jgi:hypothetical protein